MNANRESLTNHLETAAQYIYDNSVEVPGLWIFSKADIASPPKMNEGVYSKWLARNEPVSQF